MLKLLKKLIKKMCGFFPSSHVLMFHHIIEKPSIQRSGCILAYEKFAQIIMDHKQEVVSLNELVKRPSKKKKAITFDDGLEDVYTKAYPLLKQYQIPFTIFIVTDFLNKPGYITEQQLKEMASDTLVTIGAHGTTHTILPQLSIDKKEEELAKSKKILQEIIQKEVNLFAYSHGQCDKETLKLVSRYYKYACSTCSLPLNFLTKRKYLIPRINFENSTYERNKILLRK